MPHAKRIILLTHRPQLRQIRRPISFKHILLQRGVVLVEERESEALSVGCCVCAGDGVAGCCEDGGVVGCEGPGDCDVDYYGDKR